MTGLQKLQQKAQGDVLVTQSSEDSFKAFMAQVESKAPLREDVTVAYGETTGHHHKAFGEDIEVIESPMNPMQLWIVAPKGGELRHVDLNDVLTGEHDTIVFDPGWHLVDLQREADPMAGTDGVRVVE